MRFKNTCFYCKSEFQTNIHNQQFCNAECRNSIDEFICPESKTNARFVILARDNFKCAYCGATPDDGIKLEVDHIYPKSAGGGDEFINLITACEKCNGQKSGKILPDNIIKKFWTRNTARSNKVYIKKLLEFLTNYGGQ